MNLNVTERCNRHYGRHAHAIKTLCGTKNKDDRKERFESITRNYEPAINFNFPLSHSRLQSVASWAWDKKDVIIHFLFLKKG